MAQIIDGIRTNKDDIGKKTIYAGLVDSNQLPDWAKSTKSLVTEGRVIMAAGTHTTAATMSKLIYHLLSDSVRLKKLQAELEIAIPDVDSMIMVSKVDNLPYLVSAPLLVYVLNDN
jgi:benzoate 4-monooxygenase